MLVALGASNAPPRLLPVDTFAAITAAPCSPRASTATGILPCERAPPTQLLSPTPRPPRTLPVRAPPPKFPLNGIDPRRQLPRPAARSCSLPGRPRPVVLAAHPASCSPLTRPVLSASPLHKPTAARRCGAVPWEGSGAARWRAVKPARGRDGRARSCGYPSRNGRKRPWNGRSATWNAATRA